MGLPARIEDYGYHHKYKNGDGNVISKQYLPCVSQLFYCPNRQIPSKYHSNKVTGAFVIGIDSEGSLYLMKHKTRGVDIAGGHVEPGEDVRAAARREFIEETGINVENYELFQVGDKIMDALDVRTIPHEFKYPMTSTNRFYCALLSPEQTANIQPVNEDDESSGVIIVPRDQIMNHECVLIHWPFVEEAYNRRHIRII